MKMITQYITVVVKRNGKETTISRTGSIDVAKEAIQDHKKRDNNTVVLNDAMSVKILEQEGEQPYDTVGYKIYTRKVSEWEEIEICPVCNREGKKKEMVEMSGRYLHNGCFENTVLEPEREYAENYNERYGGLDTDGKDI